MSGPTSWPRRTSVHSLPREELLRRIRPIPADRTPTDAPSAPPREPVADDGLDSTGVFTPEGLAWLRRRYPAR